MGFYVNPTADGFADVLGKGRDDVFTLLVHFGYLAYDFDHSEVFIPNEEIRGEFVRAVKEGCRPELASGRGYCDILFIPRVGSRKPALLIELKWDKSAEKAISQILEKQYPEIPFPLSAVQYNINISNVQDCVRRNTAGQTAVPRAGGCRFA